MNRQERRAAEKQEQPDSAPAAAPPPSWAPAEMYSDKPGLVLRIFAAVLLSRWVLKRVHHPDVRLALASLAAQAGKTELAETLRRPQ